MLLFKQKTAYELRISDWSSDVGSSDLVIGVVTAAGGWWLLRDRPETLGLPTVAEWRNDHYGASAETKPGPRGVLSMQLSILKIPAIWVLAVSSALTYVTRYAINSWGVLYLQEARGFSLPEAGFLLMLSTLAGMAGRSEEHTSELQSL